MRKNNEEKRCFLCGQNGGGDRLERHHIFGGSRRKLSERYGLVVWLCGDKCHRNGKYAAHICLETSRYLHRYGQRKAMEENGWTAEQFGKIFGGSYL